MTARAPRSDAVSSSDMLNLSRFTMDRDTVHSKPPCLPSPRSSMPSSSNRSHEFPPLPLLAPRAPKNHRPRRDHTVDTSASLMDFVNLMSITDVARARTLPSTSFAPTTQRNSFLLAPSSSTTPELKEEEPSTDKSEAAGEMDGSSARYRASSSSSSSLPPPPLPQWSLTTPETMKVTISTPQAFRANANTSQNKRKSPLVHSTPVDGNRPLMLPTLSFSNTVAPSSSCQQLPGPMNKKAKNYKSLLSSAPMLPSSPDLEDRAVMAAPRTYHPPCFSPVNGVTLVNPHYLHRHLNMPLTSPPPPPPPRTCRPQMPAAGLPSLDLECPAQRAPKWLRMKKRTCLLTALRMAAATAPES